MTREQIKKHQREQRAKYLRDIVESAEKRKLIVAGAGTGKTYTFSKVIEKRQGGNNLAMTFIRKLVADMDAAKTRKVLGFPRLRNPYLLIGFRRS